MKKLEKALGNLIEGILVESKGSDQAKLFLDKGIMPDGEKWPRRPDIFVGFDGDVSVSGIKRTDTKKGVSFVFDLVLKPGSGGGAGATIEAAASNHFFNLAGTGKSALAGMRAAFLSAVKKDTKNLGKQLHRWLSVPDNWVHRLVGWEDRKNWTKPAVRIGAIKTSGTMIDPTRRKWPSGRTEIWVPLTVTIYAEMKKKA